MNYPYGEVNNPIWISHNPSMGNANPFLKMHNPLRGLTNSRMVIDDPCWRSNEPGKVMRDLC
jgi:hypothetical protein